MPEWLIERGIGETRAALVDDGEIIEARIELDDTVPAGTILEARLIDSGSGGRNATARVEGAADYLLPHLPAAICEGELFNIEVTRPPLPGPEPWKRPLAKATRDPRRRPRSLAERLRCDRYEVRALTFPSPADELAAAGWNDLVEEARTGQMSFPGGSLGIFPTPAMTLIDVDGSLSPPQLATAGAGAAARAVRRLDIGGSIGIDLPTARGKEARASASDAIDRFIPPPFERTAVNGFGFVQVVRPRLRASLIDLALDKAGFEARHLLRQAAFAGAGANRLVAGPRVVALLEARPEWLDALSRQLGGAVALRLDESLPIHGGYVEKA